eukprot:575302_1
MTSLAEVIRFRSSVDKLTDTEFNRFIMMLMQKCGRDILITSLFTMFTSACNRSSDTLDTTLNIIKQIIESRKTKPKPVNSYAITMKSLPSELIGNLASYLTFTEYRAFQTLNRTIYVGCNTPNTLLRLDLTKINDYSMINLAKYPHLRHLSMKLNAFDSFVLPDSNVTVCSRLQQIVLHAENRADVDITRFIAQNTINIDHITHLQCKGFGHRQNHFSFNTFTRLLFKFSNIEYLSLYGVTLPPILHLPSNLSQLFPHLQGFSWIARGPPAFLLEILTSFSSKLKKLKFSDTLVAPLPTHVTFSSLQQLMMESPQITTLDHILKTAKCLRNIVFYFDQINTTFPTRSSIQKLLTTQPLLDVIGMYCTRYDAFNDICDGIEHGLYNRKHKNKNIKLVLRLDAVVDLTKYKNILFMIEKITNQLRKLDVQNFILGVRVEFVNSETDTEWINTAFHDFQQKHSDVATYQYIFGNTCCFIVNNPGCSIAGYEPFLSADW